MVILSQKSYELSKLHESPSKARCIIAAPKRFLKPLSKSITSVFKSVFKQIEGYNKQSSFFSGVKSGQSSIIKLPLRKLIRIPKEHIDF